jgi:hypothetical protein
MLTTLKSRFVAAGLAACVLAVPAAVLGGTAASADPGNGLGAIVLKLGPGNCTLIDGNGNGAVAASLHEVVNRDVIILTCSGPVTPSPTGQALKYEGFLCGTSGGVTSYSMETVSAGGNAKLVCSTSPLT